MILNSHSLKSENPGQIRMAVIMNLNDISKSAIDYTFAAITETMVLHMRSSYIFRMMVVNSISDLLLQV